MKGYKTKHWLSNDKLFFRKEKSGNFKFECKKLSERELISDISVVKSLKEKMPVVFISEILLRPTDTAGSSIYSIAVDSKYNLSKNNVDSGKVQLNYIVEDCTIDTNTEVYFEDDRDLIIKRNSTDLNHSIIDNTVESALDKGYVFHFNIKISAIYNKEELSFVTEEVCSLSKVTISSGEEVDVSVFTQLFDNIEVVGYILEEANLTEEIDYNIYVGKNEKAENYIYIDQPQPTAFPVGLSLGGGSRKKKYMRHLENNAFEDLELLKFIAYIHKNVKKNGSIGLMCNCSHGKEIHGKVLKEFILEHREELDLVLPYLFEEYSKIDKNTSTEEKQEELEELIIDTKPDISRFSESMQSKLQANSMLFSTAIESKHQLSPSDMEKIRELIAKDQAKSNSEEQQSIKDARDELLAGQDDIVDAEVVEEVEKKTGTPDSLVFKPVISQPFPLTGLTDISNATIALKSIFIEFVKGDSKDIVSFDVTTNHSSMFIPDFVSNNKVSKLDFNSDGIVIDVNTKQHDGSELTVLSDILKDGYAVRLEVKLHGEIAIDSGECIVNSEPVRIVTMIEAGDRVTDIAVRVINYDLQITQTQLTSSATKRVFKSDLNL